MAFDKIRGLGTSVRFLFYEDTVKDKIARYRDIQEMEFCDGTVLQPGHYPKAETGFNIARRLPDGHSFWTYTTREELEAAYLAFREGKLLGNYFGFGRCG